MSLRIPGPTPLPKRVMDVMCRQMMNHRSQWFAEMLTRITERAKQIFMTKNDVLILPSSGTGGLEAAVENFFSPYDEVIATSIGYFGNRWTKIAKRHDLIAVPLVVKNLGGVIDPEEFEAKLKDRPGSKGVLLTHTETSTGAQNNIQELAHIARSHGKLVLVDAVSSLGATPVATDEWGLDVVVTASQKALMAPPGATLISISDRAWEAYERSKACRYYFDLGLAKESFLKGQTPYTPPLTVYFALEESLKMILEEGLANVFARHERIAKRFREAIAQQGWSLFADPACAANALTAIHVPEGMDCHEIIGTLEKEFDIGISGGIESLAGKIFRVAHMGNVSEKDMDEVVDALKTFH